VQYRQLGRSSLRVSAVGLGGNTFGPPRIDEAASIRVIHAAIDLGVNFVDTALTYTRGDSETFIGQALQGRRDQMIVATKFHLRALAGSTVRERILQHAHLSLRRLQTDYIDLYQIHFPHPAVPADEVLRALDDLVRAGKVREVGCCNYASWRVAEAVFTARTLGTKPFVAVQNQYNLLSRQVEEELLPFCTAYGLGLVPYWPLAGGFLTGKYRPGEPPPPGSRGAQGSPAVRRASSERNWALLPGLEQFAAERDHTLGELAIAWLLAHPAVASVITGVSNEEQLALNARAADWALTADERAAVDALAPRADEGDVESTGG
jgi:aryl-alcohol dehydrogenase-like predicted oxidoreductase